MASRTLAPRLRRLLAGPPARETKGLSGRVRTFFRQYVVPGQPYTVDWNTDRAVREGFEVNPWIFRAVHVTASKIVGKRVILRQDDPKNGTPLDPAADPTRLLHVLNVQANPWEVALVFRYRLIALFLLSSKGVFIEVVRSRAGRIATLVLLDPDMVEIMPTVMRGPDGRPLVIGGIPQVDPIGAFRVTVHDGSGPYNDMPRFDPRASFEEQPKSVLWVRSPHPTMMFRGMTPMQAAALSVDMDRAARLYNKRFMDSNGRPEMVIAVSGAANEDTLEIIEARVNGGAGSGPGGAVAIQADAATILDTSGSPRDNQWSEGMDRYKKEASMAFGVPESVLGDASGRTFDNADAEKANWLADTVVPLTDMLDAQLDALTGGYSDALWLCTDWADEWVLGRHKREEIDRAADDFAKGRRTLNEYREVAGLEPIDQPWARVCFLPGGTVVAGDPEDVAAVAKLPAFGAGQPADPGTEAQRGATIGTRAGVREAENINAARSLRLVQAGGRVGAPAAIERRDATAAFGSDELEGKQGGARAGTATTWR